MDHMVIITTCVIVECVVWSMDKTEPRVAEPKGEASPRRLGCNLIFRISFIFGCKWIVFYYLIFCSD